MVSQTQGRAMTKYLQLYRVITRTFGPRLRPIGTFGLLQLHGAVNAATLALDRVVAPRFASCRIERPVFILGNPRSGTTFLHRFLLNTDQLAAFELWEMLFPAITARKLLDRFVERLAPLSPARYHSSAAHETGLRDVETDDALMLFRFVGGAFLWTYFLAWEDAWGSETCRRLFDLEHEGPAEVERLFAYLEGCWKRNLAHKGKQRIAVKASSFTLRMRTLLARYPDCKLLYMVRDPVETIPSGMSLVTGVLERSYDMWHSTRPEARARFLENLYQASCHLFRHFHDEWRSGAIPPENLLVVRYPRMMADLEATMHEVVDFLQIEPGAGFADRVREQADRQRSRKSEHVYSPEQFGLTAERIRGDLAFVYEAYGL